MNHVEAGHDFHDRGFGCAQAVLAAFCQDYGMYVQTALKISTGFGSGMGRLCEVCGALTGGFMVLGLNYGKVNTDGSIYGPATEITYTLTAKLAEMFKEKHGTIYCRDLLGLDLSQADQRNIAIERNYFVERCGSYIQTSIKMVEVLLETPVPEGE
ncbi:MAG: C-GCAxxG-C-C family protein [Brevefilum sp.]|nr:C-GCAxxG-C-C family protein [Brevefilum sp.]